MSKSILSREEAEALLARALGTGAPEAPAEGAGAVDVIDAVESDAPAVATGLRTFNIINFEARAREMLEAAERDAEAVLAAAKAETETIRENAYQEGHAVGYDEGRTEGIAAGRKEGYEAARQEVFAACRELADSLRRLLERVDEERERLHREAGEDLLALALEIARRVTKRQIETDPAVAAENVRAAVELASGKSDLRVRVNPRDAAVVGEFLPALSASFEAVRHLVLVEDGTVPPGGAVVEGAAGRVDATVETQMDRLVDALFGSRAPRAQGGDA